MISFGCYMKSCIYVFGEINVNYIFTLAFLFVKLYIFNQKCMYIYIFTYYIMKTYNLF